MKRILPVLLALMLVCSLCAPVMADVAWTVKEVPPNDAFYLLHRRECRRIGVMYMTREACTTQKSPKNAATLYDLEQGRLLRVECEWKGWALVCAFGDSEYKGDTEYRYYDSMGWLEMSLLGRPFGFDDVDKSVYGEVKRLDRSEIFQPQEGKTFYLYSFPGSGSISSAETINEPLYYDEVWTDPQGREWGYTSYYYTAHGWVCLDDPYSRLPRIWPEIADGEIEPAAYEPDTALGAPLPTALIALVGGVALVTAAAIILLTIKKKKGRGAA